MATCFHITRKPLGTAAHAALTERFAMSAHWTSPALGRGRNITALVPRCVR
jgi:hypothetical protein